MRNIPQFLIAAPASGTGKTTVSRGLMAVLSRKGYQVQPFKCGPDYIDTKFHERVCHRPSYNLDSFMASGSHLSEIYFQHAQNADVCVVEGMMGLFDGYYRDKGSCSEIAKILRLPVILVVNAQSAAYSLAALISCLEQVPQGVLKMSETMADTVETSNNIGRVMTEDGCIFVSTHTRSFIDQDMDALSRRIADIFASCGAKSETVALSWHSDCEHRAAYRRTSLHQRACGTLNHRGYLARSHRTPTTPCCTRVTFPLVCHNTIQTFSAEVCRHLRNYFYLCDL